MFSKTDIYNQALSYLLLSKRIQNPDSDTSNEAVVLNSHYLPAVYATLENLNLDITSTIKSLQLIENCPDDFWKYAYKYPSKCAHFRRVIDPTTTCLRGDNRYTRIELRIAMLEDQKVIYTNQEYAKGEWIRGDVPVNVLSPSAALAIAARLAIMSSPLIVGKGALKLMEQLSNQYKVLKADAQAQDENENFNYDSDQNTSEFVLARTT